MDDGSRTARRERHLGPPLGAASLLRPASYVVRVLAPGLPGPAGDLCLAVTAATWTLFVVDCTVRRRLSGQGCASSAAPGWAAASPCWAR